MYRFNRLCWLREITHSNVNIIYQYQEMPIWITTCARRSGTAIPLSSLALSSAPSVSCSSFSGSSIAVGRGRLHRRVTKGPQLHFLTQTASSLQDQVLSSKWICLYLPQNMNSWRIGECYKRDTNNGNGMVK